MALINTIRKNAGLAVGVVAGGLILFLLGGDVLRFGTAFSNNRQLTVGEIAGQKVSLQTYQDKVEEVRSGFARGAKVREAYIQVKAWGQLLEQIAYQKEYKALGLQVGAEELVDMVQGSRIHPDIQGSFRDPETNKFDKQELIDYLQRLPQASVGQQVRWHQFEETLMAGRNREKFIQLMRQSTFLSWLEAQDQYEAANATRSVRCLYVPYYSFPDDQVQLTDAMLQQYLDAHRDEYQTIESRDVQYITFPARPTVADEEAFQQSLQDLRQSFAQAQDAFAFARLNTDGASAAVRLRVNAQQLPQALAQQKVTLSKGSLIGPVQEGSVHKFYKVMATRPQYDIAVVERHLLPGDRARDQAFRRAEHCAGTLRDANHMAVYGVQEDLPVREVRVNQYTTNMGVVPKVRGLVQWLYSDAKVGRVSPVFEFENDYVVAVMTGQSPAGTASLDQVRNEVMLKVRNEQKAHAIVALLLLHAAEPLEVVATQYGEGARLLPAAVLRFEDDVLQDTGMARKAVGAAFALQPGERATVADDNGVLVVELVDSKAAPPVEDISTYQQDWMQIEKIKQPRYVLQGMEELAHIKDYRHQFY